MPYGGDPLLLLSLIAPGVLLWRRMRGEGVPRLMALATAVLICMLWSVPIALILAAAHASVVPGSLWVAVITGLVLTETVGRRG